jgi:ZIP family zinc transporter
MEYISVLGWGLIPASGIILGALVGVYARLTHRDIARAMAFGAGMLLAAAAVELAADALESAPWSGLTALMVGAIVFSLGNSWLSRLGAENRKRCGECVAQPSEHDAPNSGLAIALGTALDAVPESLILGLTLSMGGPDIALIAAFTIGNLPEALSASAGMKAAGRPTKWILALWGGISLGTALLTIVGYAISNVASERLALLIQAFGTGALLAMVSETLLPEAAQGSPRFSGIVAAAGFSILVSLGVLFA